MFDIVIHTFGNMAVFAAGLQEALPQARIHCWPRASGSAAADGSTAGATAAATAISQPATSIPACKYAVLWRPPAELLASQDRLEAIFTVTAGVDTLLDLPNLPAGVPIVRLEDAGMADQMVEYALYAALHRFRSFDEYRGAQAERIWQPLKLRRRADFNVGILGLGALGSRVARVLADFGFRVSAWSRTAKQVDGLTCRYGPAGLTEVLSGSAVLIVLLPLTADTRGILNRQTLALLPEGAALVNLARGPLIVDDDLLALLDAGRIGRAFLDVFATEPLPPEHRFWTHPRVSITPHIAAITPRLEAIEQIADKIRRLEEGLPISGIVQPGRGY